MKKATFYPALALQKLEWDKIREQLVRACLSPLGVKQVEKMELSADTAIVETALLQTREFLNIIETQKGFPINNYLDLGEILSYFEIEASVLHEEQFLLLLLFLKTVRDIYRFFLRPSLSHPENEHYPHLRSILEGQHFENGILQAIASVISEEGTVKPGVSEELDKIRSEIRHHEKDLERKFHSILQLCLGKGWLAPEAESVRSGRRVLCLLSEHKRKLKGIIHDESATGKTVFLEPEQTIEISNELTEARLAERREIYRILRQLSEIIRPHTPMLRHYQMLAGRFDFIRAKALFAQTVGGAMPKIAGEPKLSLIKASHPVLVLHNRSLGRSTVPLDVSLNAKDRILVISGPNAGGKSVALKTVGLLQLMFQFGLLIPASPDSEMGVFGRFFVELGDEQSIENDLSTYSSHLLHMKHLTENITPDSLVLIDEFGTGTDPKFGGPIAEAILETLNLKKVKGVITTHYSNLKLFAAQTSGIVNGSMLFNFETLSPLYLLKIGEPGSSQAIEIAEKVGLDKEIISRARKKMDKEYLNFDSLLASMETDKHVLNLDKAALARERAELTGLIETYRRLKEDMEQGKQKILSEVKLKALHEVEEKNKKLERLIRELEQKEDKQEAQRSRKIIQKERTELHGSLQQLKEKARTNQRTQGVEIKTGTPVRVVGSSEVGVVEEIRNKKALVAFGNLRSLVRLEDLEPAGSAEPGRKEKAVKRRGGLDVSRAVAEFNTSVDVHGMRVEEALPLIEKMIDRALLTGANGFRIVHGKGTGALRKAIRQMLGKYQVVREFHGEPEQEGGDGVTVVRMK